MSILIDSKKVEEITGLSRSTIYRIEMAGDFPERIALSTRSVRWVESEVVKWVSDLILSNRQNRKCKKPRTRSVRVNRASGNDDWMSESSIDDDINNHFKSDC